MNTEIWSEYDPSSSDSIDDDYDSNRNIFGTNFKYLQKFVSSKTTNICWPQNQIDTGKLCLKAFRKGELGYTCWDCKILQRNSILCLECFQNSKHINHKFKIQVISARQFCMCGHEEAWKQSSSCRLHKREGRRNHSLAEKLLKKVRVVFRGILNHACDVLTKSYGFENPAPGSCFVFSFSTNITSTRALMIGVFQKFLVNCSELQATKLVKSFSKHGRVLIEFTSLPDALTFKSRMETFFANKPQLYLQMSIIPINDIVAQQYAVSLLSRLEALMIHEDFRTCFAQIMLSQASGKSILERLLKKEPHLCLEVNKKFQTLITLGMLHSLKGKIDVATIFMKNIGYAVDSFEKNNSFNSLYFSLKLFYFPAVAHVLIADEDGLFIIGNRLVTVTVKLSERLGKFELSTLSQKFLLEAFCVLLNTTPTAWTTQLRKGFLKGLTTFLTFLEKMQGMEPNTRKTGEHVEVETNNSNGILINFGVAQCSLRVLEWCSSDKEVLIQTYIETIKILKQHRPSRETNSVSIHTPLTRFLAGLHLHLEKFDLHFNAPEFRGIKLTVKQIIEPALRTQAMITQAEAGMWVRNGAIVPKLIVFYRNNNGRVLDRDIQLLQIGASVMNDYEFIDDLEETFLSLGKDENSSRIYENLLRLLINITGERHLPEMSNVEPNCYLKREIIHLLCLKPLTHSELVRGVIKHHPECDLKVLDKIVDKIATFKKTGDGPGVYELKDDFLDQYDPFFLHYTNAETFSSHKAQCEKRKLKFCPPPNLPELKKSFHGIVAFLEREAMQRFLEKIFKMFICWGEHTTELMLQEILYLVGYALQEEQTNYYPFFKFSTKAKNWNLKTHLENLLKNANAKEHHDLVRWTLTKYKEVAKEETQTKIDVDDALEEQKLQEKAKLIAARRENILKNMKMAQNKFLQENEVTENETEEVESVEETYTCVVCQKTEKLDETTSFLLPAFIQKSVLFRPKTADVRFSYPFFNANCEFLPHTKTCPHVIHTTCWKKYSATQTREQQPENKFFEFFCPLCQCLRNTLLPVLPKFNSPLVDIKFSAWLENLSDPKNYEFNFWAFQKSRNLERGKVLQDVKEQYDKFADLYNPYFSSICQSLAYTLHGMEVTLRDSNKPLTDLSSSDKICLKVLSRVLLHLKYQSPTSGNYAYIKNLLRHSVYIRESESINVFLDLIFSGHPLNTISPHLIRFILIAHIVKILIASDLEDEEIEEGETNYALISDAPVIRILNSLHIKTINLDENQVWRYVQESSLSFLRCFVLLYQHMTEKPLPSNLTKLGGDTFSNMCSYLGIPQTQQEIFAPEEMLPIIGNWCNLFNYNMIILQKSITTNQLIALPEDYNDLIKQYSMFACSSSGAGEKHLMTKSKHPTLCLLCGQILCSGGFCCKNFSDGVITGECYNHTSECGNGAGMFLSINTFQVLLVSMSIGHIWVPSPYVNSYGESGLTYNYRLRLCPNKYKALNKLWLNHQIMEEIARKTPIKNHKYI